MRVWLVLIFVFVSMATARDQLYDSFQNPPPEARPFVRWWWNGNCVREDEIVRELDILKAAGIGGVEINPIAMPEEVAMPETGCLSYASPEWASMVKFATDEAKDRGMIVDIIIGTGWPFGGQFLKPEEQIKGLVVNTVEVEGPSEYKATLNAVAKVIRRGKVYLPDPAFHPPNPRLRFMVLVPKNFSQIDQIVDVRDGCSANGDILIQVPAGVYTLAIGTVHRGTGFRLVDNGAPGADGPCLDHYNQSAVIRYCDRLGDALRPVIGDNLGSAIRALFVDSIELSGANWTDDLLAEFENRCGYDVTPYLPFVVLEDAYTEEGYQNVWTDDPQMRDVIRRARYDFNRTLTDIFLERFTQAYHQWCHDHGVLSRYQAYGHPWLMGMPEGYLIPDIPESNGWMFSPNAYWHGYYVWNKYASSGGHLAGRKIISSEAMTNTKGVFQTTLEYIKHDDDMNFIMGINHSVLHGFNYSPPDVGFPGWVRYGTYFSEQNPWWPYFKLWSQYNARLSAIFQNSQPAAEVAVLAPAADWLSSAGLARVPFHLQPWYCHRLWEPLQQIGAGVDYLHEMIIQKACKERGMLKYGRMAYKMLILAGVETLQLQTARALQEFASVGGKIVFVEKRPHRSPSLLQAAANDREIMQTIDRMMDSFQNSVVFESAPVDESDLIPWSQRLLQRLGVDLPVSISPAHKEVFQIYHQCNDRDIFFFVNSDYTKSREFTAHFRSGNGTPWKWDPETGERSLFAVANQGNKLSIQLEPLQSLLLVFEPDARATLKAKATKALSKAMEIHGPWHVRFEPVADEPFEAELSELKDPGQSTDSRLATFAGQITYRASFDFKKTNSCLLDLGRVHGVSEVKLNGQALGQRWYGRHRYDCAEALIAGTNSIEITVTTVLLNYVKSLVNNPTAQKWTADQLPVAVGLLGPVGLYPIK